MKYSIVTSCYNQLKTLKRLREALNMLNFTDFEWVLADDGSNDGTDKWAKDNADHHVWQHDNGYRLSKILNKASKVCTGEYLVWIMGDSYPAPSFLNIVDKNIDKHTLATGLRLNIKDGKYYSHDWRTAFFNDRLLDDSIEIAFPEPYRAMTLNSMIMPKAMWDEMGGIDEGYDEGYGKMDWWMGAWAHYAGYDLKVFPKAIVYHDLHDEREDTENNTHLFFRHLEELKHENSV